jgi:hypothetical protein
MFSKRNGAHVSTQESPSRCLNPATGNDLEPKATPGYYPGFHTLTQQNYWDAATREVVLNRISDPPAIRFFTAEEAATMEAVVNRVLPQDDRAADMRIPILPHIDERLYLNRIEGYRYEDMPSDQDTYRLAAKAIEAMAQALHGTSLPFRHSSRRPSWSLCTMANRSRPRISGSG